MISLNKNIILSSSLQFFFSQSTHSLCPLCMAAAVESTTSSPSHKRSHHPSHSFCGHWVIHGVTVWWRVPSLNQSMQSRFLIKLSSIFLLILVFHVPVISWWHYQKRTNNYKLNWLQPSFLGHESLPVSCSMTIRLELDVEPSFYL